MEHKFAQATVWLHRYLKLDPAKGIRSDELYHIFTSSTKLNINCKTFGSLVTKVFPSVEAVRDSRRVCGKRAVVYAGLTYKPVPEEQTIINICEIGKHQFLMEMVFFIMKQERHSCDLGYIYDVKINDTPVLVKITIANNPILDMHVSVFGHQLSSAALGATGLSLTPGNMEAVLKVVRGFTFCRGQSIECGISLAHRYVREKLQLSSTDAPITVFRSANCKRILTDERGLVCRTCQKQKVNTQYTIRKRSTVCTKPQPATVLSTVQSNNAQSSSIQSATVQSATISSHDSVTESPQNQQAIQTEGLVSQLFPGLQEDSEWKKLLHSQIDNYSRVEKRQYRWTPRVIKFYLMLWGRSPSGYEDLRDSSFLILPSIRLLQYYKNAIQQKPGIQQQVLQWMRNEADRLDLKSSEGGLIFDEMSIQEDIYIEKNGTLCGLSNLGDVSNAISVLKTGKDEAAVANHVLQLVFLGDSGFRFPFAHYPCRESTAADLFNVLWESIGALRDYGFRVNYISMDGASSNRSLMHLHFEKHSLDFLRSQNFEVKNPMPPNNRIVFLMDPSHCFKKIRNNVLKSGEAANCKRNLQVNGQCIHWKSWIQAYRWDCQENSMRVHHRLTEEHIFPDSAQKMRNHLAEDVLNSDMLYLVQSYQRSLSSEEGGKLNGVIQFLTNTATLIKILRDHRPVFKSNDDRLVTLEAVHAWFLQWEADILSQNLVGKQRTVRKKMLMSDQTREDLSSAVLGFVKLAKNVTGRKLPGSIVPGRVNIDVVENVFCQQRGLYHGNTTNPNYHTYCYGMNTILLGQSSISRKRKSNCGSSVPGPVCCETQKPIRPHQKSKHMRI